MFEDNSVKECYIFAVLIKNKTKLKQNKTKLWQTR